MKRHLFFAILTLALLCGGRPARALTATEFNDAIVQYLRLDLSPATLLGLCHEAIDRGNAMPENVRTAAYAWRGALQLMSGNTRQATEDARRALELNKQVSMARFVLAACFAQTGDYPSAAAEITAAGEGKKDPAQLTPLRKMADFLHSATASSDLKRSLATCLTYRPYAPVLTPAILWDAFDENEILAEDLYMNKTLPLSGTVRAITVNSKGEPVLRFALDELGARGVTCLFTASDRAKLRRLKKGQVVLVLGECAGKDGANIVLRHAALIDT